MGGSDQDLKAQLSDIQKRLSEATFHSPKRPHQNNHESPASVRTGPRTYQPSQLSNSSTSEQKSDKKTLSNFLSKREKRVSLPVLESSKSPSIKNSGKDMDFVVGLSENLLAECRRLQAENQQKSTQLKTFEEELSKLKYNNSSLTSKLNETVEKEEKFKDLNWELELKFQQLSQEFKVTSENYLKSQKELTKQLNLSNEIRTELEEAQLHKHSLQEEFSTNTLTVTQEIQSLKSHVDELNDVNSRLNDELDELRHKLNEAIKKPKETPFSAIPILQPKEDSDSEDEFNEPGISPVKIIPSNITALETEQLQSSLSNAHQTIAKLRQQILKLRSNELRSKSPESKATTLAIPALNKPPKNSNETIRNLPVLGNSNRSSTYVVEESEADEWENFEGDSTFSNAAIPSSPIRGQQKRPVSIYSNELIDDSESDIDNENFQVAPLSSEISPISIEEVEKYAEEHNLVLLPIEEFQTLKTAKSPVKDSPFKSFKEADIVSKAKERGFNIFSQQEWSNQQKELDSKNLEVKSLNDRLFVTSETEKKYAKEAADYRLKLDAALAAVVAENVKVLGLETQLSNPSESYLKEQALKHNLQVLSLDEYEDLQTEISSLEYKMANPSVDFITAKGESLGLKVLKVEVQSNLLSEIESLKSSFTESELSKKALQDQLDALTESSKQIESENEELSSKLESLKVSSTQIYNAKLELEQSMKSNLETSEVEKQEFLSFKKQIEDEKQNLQDKLDSLALDVENHVATKEELESKLLVLNEEVDQHKILNEDLHSKFTAISETHDKALADHSAVVELLSNESTQKLHELSESSAAKLAVLSLEIETLKAAEASHLKSLETEVRSKEELQKAIEQPSVEYIKEKASVIGLRAVEVSAYEKELNDFQSAITSLEVNLTAKTTELFEKDKETSELINDLKKQIDEPSIEYFQEKAASSNYKVLPVSAYDDELQELNNNIRLLEEELDSTKKIEVLSSETIGKLRTEIDSPTVDYLTEKASSLDYKLLPNSVFNSLSIKSEKTLEELANEKDSVVVTKERLDELNNPTKEIVTAKAENHGLVTVPFEEHEKLLSISQSPTLEHITEKAKLLGYQVVSNAEHSDLLKTISSPNKEFITKNAAVLGLVAVSQAEFDQNKEELFTLKKELAERDLIPANNASADDVVVKQADYDELFAKANLTVDDLAKEQNKVILDRDAYESLLNPATESIISHADKNSLAVIAKEDYLSLVRENEHPSIEHLKTKAALHDQVVVSKSHYDTLKTNVDEPSVEYLKEKAANSGLCVLYNDEFDELKTKSNKSIEELSREQKKVLLSETEHESLKNPDTHAVAKLAAAVGLTTLATHEFDLLKKSVDTPDVKYLTEKAKLNSQVILSQTEFDHLKTTEQSPSVEFLSSKAKSLNLSLIPADELVQLQTKASKSISDIAKENNQVVLSQDEFDTLKIIKDSPSVEFLSSKAQSANMSLIPVAELTQLQIQANRSISDIAKEKDHVVLSQDEYKTLKAIRDSPSIDFLSSKAKSQNYSMIPVDELVQLQTQVSKPIQDVAAENNQVVLSQDEYKSLKEPSKASLLASVGALGLVALGVAEHAKLVKPSKVDLEKFANTENLVLVPKDSFSELTQKSSKSVNDLAKESGLKVLTQDEFSQLANPNEERLKNLVTAAGLVIVSKDAYSKLVTPSENDIVELAETNGLVAVSNEVFSTLKTKAENPDDDLLKQKGYVLKDQISYHELEELAGRFHSKLVDVNEHHQIAHRSLTVNANPSITTLSSTINESEFTDALSRADSNTSTIDGSEIHHSNLNVDELRATASRLGFSIVPLGESGNRDSVIEGDYSGFDTLGRDASIDEKEQVLRRAQNLGLVVLEEHDYYELANKEIDEAVLQAKAKELDLQLLSFNEVQSLKNPEEEKIRAASEKLGLVVLTNQEMNSVTQNAIESVNADKLLTADNIKSIGSEYGFKVLSNDEYESLKNSQPAPSSWDLAKLSLGASALGLAVVDKKSDNVSKSLSKDDIISKAGDFGLVAIRKEDYNVLAVPAQPSDVVTPVVGLTREDIISKASEFGLVAVTEADLNELKAKSESVSVSKENIIFKPSQYGTVAVDKNEFNEITTQTFSDQSIKTKSIISEDTNDEFNDETEEDIGSVQLTRQEVEDNARNLGLLTIPENAFIATNVSRVPDVNNVVVLPITYYNKLTKSEALNLDKITNEELQEQISKRGLQITFDNDDRDSSSHLTRKSTITSLSTSNSRKNLADAAESAAAYEFDHPTGRSSRSHSRVPSISHSRAGSLKPISRDISVDGGLSLMTNASLTEARIIPALTQTVIGEYLHKYYRRLGPLSSISETRHERYFWIHPYTLTLYWSSTNPVLGNPASRKTRAAAIIGVESVDDNNPLPVGLHHKSIIVHSQTRSIKFTCPTRQRHNIWYNSLRYLIQRSMDGIELDEDFDHLLDNRL